MRVLLVDDHLSFRQPLAFMLQRESDIDVVGQAGSLAEARVLLANVDVVLLDLDLTDGSGVDLIWDLRSTDSRAKVLVLSASADRREVGRAVEAGAVGVLHKSRPVEEIVTAVRRLAAGETLLSPAETVDLLRFVGQLRDRDRAAQLAFLRLTPRECDVLSALADGLPDREIAERLKVSTETVRTHMVNLLQKLGVDSRLQALIVALRHGLVKID